MNKIWSGEHFLLAKSGFHEKVESHELTYTTNLLMSFRAPIILADPICTTK